MTNDGRRMSEDVNPQLGLSRRDVLRRGAIVSGTLMWAAPTVQALAPKAFAQTTGTPPPDEEGGQAISYLAFVLHNNDPFTRYKYEDNGACKLEKGGKIKNCESALTNAQLAAWNGATQANANNRVTVDCTTSDSVWTIMPEPGYGVLFAVVKSGSQGKCSVFDNNGAPRGYPKNVNVQVFQK